MAESIDAGYRNVNDGYFELTYQSEGVFLTVFPPVGKGRKVDLNQVIEKLNKKQLRGFIRDQIELAVLRSDRQQVRIADSQEEAKIDATASVMISPDKMKAVISISPPEGGRMLTFEEVLSILNKHGVIFGINRTTMDTIIKYPVYNELITIAEGTASQNGVNGKVEYYFDVKRDNKPTILEDGTVDYRDLNLITNVKQGQKLCTLVPPQPGVRGKTVVGIDIPALDGKPAVLPRGRNVESTADGMYLFSAIDGQVNLIDGKVNVFANYEVPADVDNSTGNISFVGNVIVRGNVLSGFTIEAGGKVEVWGVVEGATIKAGGDIILRRGMSGVGKGLLISGGDIIAKYIENATLEAQNDIKSESIMHSHVKSGNKVEMAGKKGLLVGGSIKVGREIIAKVIGSHMATVTELEVGVDPTLREKYKSLKNENTAIEVDLKKAEQAITLLKKLEAAGLLTPDKQEIMQKSVRTKIYFNNRIAEIKEEVASIEARLQQDAYGKIRVNNYIYPGVKVAIGTCLMYVKEPLHYCTLYRDGADIRIGPIDK